MTPTTLMPYIALIALLGVVAVVGAVAIHMMRKGDKEAAVEAPPARHVRQQYRDRSCSLVTGCRCRHPRVALNVPGQSTEYKQASDVGKEQQQLPSNSKNKHLHLTANPALRWTVTHLFGLYVSCNTLYTYVYT